MTRFGIVFAISISVALIGGASWFRFVNAVEYKADLVAVNRLEENYLRGEITIDEFNEEVTETMAEPLTQTDIFSRQLFSDYVSLSSQNQATPENLQNLGQKYAQAILDLTDTKEVTIDQIIIVSDSTENLSNYGSKIFQIYSRYQSAVANYDKSGITDINDEKFKAFMTFGSDTYKKAAAEFQNVPVPASLAENHLALINSQLSSSNAMKILTNTQNDPLGAYAALDAQVRYGQEETFLINSIKVAMLTNNLPIPGI